MPAFRARTDSHVPFDRNHAAFRGHRYVGDLDAADRAAEDEVTLVLRENPAGPTIDEMLDLQAGKAVLDRQHLTSVQLAANHGWAKPDYDKVAKWAKARGLTVVHELSDQSGRRLRVRGSISKLDAAFGTRSKRFEFIRPDGSALEYRRTLSAPMLPTELNDIITAVQGLSQIPFSPRFQTLGAAAPKQVYTPEELAQLYNFPQLPNGGQGVTLNVGICELGGAVNPKVAAWFLAQPQYANCSMTEFAVNNAPMTPDPNGADIEVALDWQVVMRALVEAAPQANINILVSYGANSDQGFADGWNVFVTNAGITSAKTYNAANPSGVTVDPKTVDATSVSGVSTSWGQNESGWSAASIQTMDQVAGAGALKGVFFANASGDDGATDRRADGKLDADAPSLCANVLAVGGTQLNSTNGQITSEPVWNQAAAGRGAGGGGISRVVPVPGYQTAAGINIPAVDDGHTGRIDPDCSANADPATGYDVVTDIDATGNPTSMPVGGTSASTPLIVAGFALVAELTGKKLGRVQDTLYALGPAGTGINDVTVGDNAYPTGTKGYAAGPGFDAASGWGSLNFGVLAQAWGTTVPTPAPVVGPTPTPAPCGPAAARAVVRPFTELN